MNTTYQINKKQIRKQKTLSALRGIQQEIIPCSVHQKHHEVSPELQHLSSVEKWHWEQMNDCIYWF